jgi:hypothetical protein
MITEYMLNMHLPTEVARSFVKDMEAFQAEPNRIRRDAIAARAPAPCAPGAQAATRSGAGFST